MGGSDDLEERSSSFSSSSFGSIGGGRGGGVVVAKGRRHGLPNTNWEFKWCAVGTIRVLHLYRNLWVLLWTVLLEESTSLLSFLVAGTSFRREPLRTRWSAFLPETTS
jgi:hypothetical protein